LGVLVADVDNQYMPAMTAMSLDEVRYHLHQLASRRQFGGFTPAEVIQYDELVALETLLLRRASDRGAPDNEAVLQRWA
jgi:hypothetical protein